MKALILSHLYPNAVDRVAGLFVQTQVVELARPDVEVRVVAPVPWSPVPIRWLTPKWRRYAEIPQEGCLEGIQVSYPRYLTFPRAFLFEYAGWSFFYAVRRAVAEIYREFPFDLIHAHWALPAGYGAMLLNRSYCKPLIVTMHSLDTLVPWQKGSEKRLVRTVEVFRAANRILCVSALVRNQCLDIDGDVPQDKFAVVLNGISPEITAHSGQAVREKYPGRRLLLTVGNIRSYKGHSLVIQALQKIVKRWPDVLYLIVGSGEEEPSLRRLVQELDLQNHVEFCGSQGYALTMQYMAACEIFVMPSWSETFGIVFIEAMARGKPTIACKGQGIEDVITDGETGFLVEPKSVESLTIVLEQLLTDPDLGVRVGEKGKTHVLENFTWRRSAQRMVEIYQEVVKEG
jgi:teichuronic acid biosynthesis glycosyltransferase TuaC